MNLIVENHRILLSRSQISVRFQVAPPAYCPALREALLRISLLPGCLDYKLTDEEQAPFHWLISGIWMNEGSRHRHYCSEQLQVLFRYMIERNACWIRCSEGPIEDAADRNAASARRCAQEDG